MKLDVWQKNSRTLSFFQFSRPALSLIVAVLALVLLTAPALALTWINNAGLGYNFVYGVYANGNMVYAATCGDGLFISTDGGVNFSQKTKSVNGLIADCVNGVYANGNTVYAAITDNNGGLSISTDGGNTFTSRTISNGLGSKWVTNVYADGGKIYVASGYFDDVDMRCLDGGVSISTDGGSTFSNKTNGLGNNCVLDVYASGNTVYAGTEGGLAISTDGGNTFNNKTTTDGLAGNRVTEVYTDGGKIYAATQRYEFDSSYGYARCLGGGLSISTDGGNTFSNKLGGNCLNAVYASGGAIYAATRNGLFISTDGGNTFTNDTTANGLGSNSIRDVYANGGKVYAATSGGLSIAAGITDLQSQPDSEVGKVKLSWTAPDVSAGSGSSTKYDIRYSSGAPLDESNWISATQVQAEPTPASPGVTQTMTISIPMTNTQRYFGIKVVDSADKPLLPLSNVPSLLDIGFRPSLHGYSFKNWGGDYLDWYGNFSDFTFEDMRRMLGTNAVCIDDQCQLRRHVAEIWLDNVNKDFLQPGRCGGFASTSLRFFLGDDNPSSFQTGVNTTIEFWPSYIRRHISYYQILANLEPIRPTILSTQQPISKILDELRSGISNRDPRVLFIGWVISDAGKIKNRGAHYVTPYAIEEQGNGKWNVWVYDSNELNRLPPIPIPQAFTINKDAWEYRGLRGSDSNNNQTGLAIIPISQYKKSPLCRWCNGRGFDTSTQDIASSATEVWLTGSGHLLITDSQGRRIGFVDDQFVREIPDAYDNVIAAGLGDEVEPIYVLPLTDTNTILLDGQTLTQTGKTAVTQFGPGYAIAIDDIPLNSTSRDQITFAPDGKQLSYHPNQTKAVTFTLALDQADSSSQFQVKNLTIGANKSVTITADLDHHQLILNNTNNGSSQYDLVIEILTGAGEYTFYHPGITIAATDTHYVSYNPANSSGPVTISIDHGSNGTIDEVISVANQPQAEHRVYLPMLRK